MPLCICYFEMIEGADGYFMVFLTFRHCFFILVFVKSVRFLKVDYM